MDLDTRHLRALVAVVDEGTFTDAAIGLGVSQASVTRSVQRLEALLGVRLLSRTSRHVQLTPAGEQVLAHARRLLATVAELEAVGAGAEQRTVLGYAWAALGGHTVALQRAWRDRGYGDLVLVQTNTLSAGLLEGRCEMAVVRRPVTDARLTGVRLGEERRCAAVATDHPLAGLDAVRLADLAGETVAVDAATGTTSPELWPPPLRPPAFTLTHGVDEWLTLIASGRAVGVSSEATAAQHPRPGLTYRPVPDAPSVPVWLVWWRSSPPRHLDAMVELAAQAYPSRTGTGTGT